MGHESTRRSARLVLFLVLLSGVVGATALSQTVTIPPPDTTIPDTIPPTPPTDIRAVLVSTGVKVSWASSQDNVGVVRYKVYRNGTAIKETSSTSVTDADTDSGVQYMYTVTAGDAAGNNSPMSAPAVIGVPTETTTAPLPDSLAPTAPSALSVVASSEGAKLEWSAATDNVGVTEYRVYRDGSQIAETNQTKYTDASAPRSVALSYMVRAKDAAGNVSSVGPTKSVTLPPESTTGETTSTGTSSTATTATATTTATTPPTATNTSSGADTTAPSVPGGLRAELNGRAVLLTWEAATDTSGVMGYRLIRNGVVLRVLTERKYLDTDVDPGKEYTYVVRARDAMGNESVASQQTTVRVPITATAISSVSSTSGVTQTTETGLISGSAPDKETSTTTEVYSEDTPPTFPLDPERNLDSDLDGLSDAEEKLRGTNPVRADTDGDGYPDGEEVRRGFNPLKASTAEGGDRILFQSVREVRKLQIEAASVEQPQTVAPVEDRRYRVEKIERIEREDGRKATRLSGRAMPNTFVTVYIYSDPIVVVVKTDADGNWTYDVEVDLDDGEHEAYVAVTNSEGQVVAASVPLPFVKTAQAITVKAEAATVEAAPATSVERNDSPAKRKRTELIVIALLMMLTFVGLVIVIIKRFAMKNETPPSNTSGEQS